MSQHKDMLALHLCFFLFDTSNYIIEIFVFWFYRNLISIPFYLKSHVKDFKRIKWIGVKWDIAVCIKGMFSILKFSLFYNILIHISIFSRPRMSYSVGTSPRISLSCSNWWALFTSLLLFFQTSQFLKGFGRNPGMRYLFQMPFWIGLHISDMAENCALSSTLISLENLWFCDVFSLFYK